MGPRPHPTVGYVFRRGRGSSAQLAASLDVVATAEKADRGHMR